MSRKTPTLNPRLLGLKCIRCNTLHDVGDYAEGCPLCGKAGYPISVAPVYSSLPPLTANVAGYGMQAFADRLPYSTFLSLGEGNTPAAPLDQAAEALGLQSVTLKLESSNPTGSHKDRMTAQFVARAVARQAPVVAAASSGNAGASLAAYAAASNLKCVIVTTPKISPAWRRAIEMAGADLHYVDNPLERWSFIRAKTRDEGWLSATNVLNPPTGSEPFGVDGYKTVAYELATDPNTKQTDTVVVPAARGDLLWGIYAGYKELVDERAIDRMPRLVAVEPFPRLEFALAGADWRGEFSGTSPMVSINGSTLAYQAVAAVERSSGIAVSVNSEQVIDDQKQLARSGFYVELSAAAALTGLRQVCARIATRNAVLIATSHGYKEISPIA
jgi:threonine synthase